MTILHKIVDQKKSEVADLRRKFTRDSFINSEMFAIKSLDFLAAIRKKRKINVIAEIKKASPSKGVLRKDFNHLEIAKNYMKAGADAISVLTDNKFFRGDINDLKEIAEIKIVPLLRKDFIIDELQIFEAKANGADAILLISEILTREQIKDFTSAAKSIGLEILLEVHSAEQFEKIDFSTNNIIGINNRNLENFSVDINTTREIAKLLPKGITVVSESGISSKGELDFLKNTDTYAVLVGEYFMKSRDIESSLTQFIEWCNFAN